MKNVGIVLIILGIVGLLIVLWLWGSYNNLVNLDEKVNEAWSQVENVYQRRFDLIPNLVETVKGYASHERGTFEAINQARASATAIKADVRQLLESPELFGQFEEAQGQLTAALGRLMVVVENYPELKANKNFLHLQDELAGTENRIAVERRRYNKTAQDFNKSIRQFPKNLVARNFGFEKRNYFKAEEGADKAPKVKFD